MAEATPQAGKRTGQRGLGWSSLVAFIAVSVILIVLIWGDNLAGVESDTPSYYRDTFVVDESVYATVTAEAAGSRAGRSAHADTGAVTGASNEMSQTVSAGPTGISRRKFLHISAAAGAMVLAGGVLTPALFAARATTRSAVRTLMGTRIHLTVAGADGRAADAAIDATFAAMQRLITIFDHRQPGNAVAILNRTGALDDAPVELIEVMRRAVAYGALTGGAFDVTVKPLLDVRRAGAHETAAVQSLVDYRQIEIDDQRIQLGIPGAAVTLDGIAKGRVIDGGVQTLRQLGFDHVLVEAGGDLRTLGARADGTPWRVGIAHPRPAAQGDVLYVLPIGAQAVATSGDYMNTLTADYSEHHIVNPRSGQSPTELASATVLAKTALDADALGTALMVLGAHAGLALAERLPAVEALLVTKDLRVLKTSGIIAD